MGEWKQADPDNLGEPHSEAEQEVDDIMNEVLGPVGTVAAVHDHADHAVRKGCPRCFQIGVGLVSKEGTAMLVSSGMSKQDIAVFAVLSQKATTHE